MSDQSLPAPLVPAEVDLRDFDYMPLYGERLFGSDTWAMCDADEKVAALNLWWSSWKEEPAGSLTDNDRVLAKAAGYGVAVKEFQKAKPNAMRGWIKCSDGRLYHPVVASIALEVWKTKKKKETENAADRERKRLKRLGLSGGTSGGQDDNSGGQGDGIPAEIALKGRDRDIPPTPLGEGGSDGNGPADEDDDAQPRYRDPPRPEGPKPDRPSRANGTNPRAIAEALEAKALSDSRVAKWAPRLRQFADTGHWDRTWGNKPSLNPAVTETGVFLPPALWDEFRAIARARARAGPAGKAA